MSDGVLVGIGSVIAFGWFGTWLVIDCWQLWALRRMDRMIERAFARPVDGRIVIRGRELYRVLRHIRWYQWIDRARYSAWRRWTTITACLVEAWIGWMVDSPVAMSVWLILAWFNWYGGDNEDRRRKRKASRDRVKEVAGRLVVVPSPAADPA